MRLSSPLGKLMITTLRWNQLIAGTSTVITNDHHHELEYMPTTWWKGIRTFLKKIDGSLTFEDQITPTSNVINDCSIMDAVLDGAWNTDELRQINSVRLYLQVFFLSDIIHPHENKILPHFLAPHQQTVSESRLQWPVTSQPSKSAWLYWRRAVKQAFAITRHSV